MVFNGVGYLGLSKKDFRIFYSKRDRNWIIANDYKKRRLMDKGYSRRKAKDLSHGHVNKEETAIKIKIRDNILANKKEKSRDLWVLGCYTRICDKTYKHYSWVCGLYKTKKAKAKQKYVNRRGGVIF